MNHRISMFIVLWFTILFVDDNDHDQASAGCRRPWFPGKQGRPRRGFRRGFRRPEKP